MGHNDSSKDTNENSKDLNRRGNTEILQGNQNDSKKSAGPKKVFTHRNSVLTDLMEVNHLQTFYNIWVATFVLLFINLLVYYNLTPEKLWRDLGFVSNALSNKLIIVKFGIFFNIYTFLIFYGFKTWIGVRYKINTKLADLLFLFTYIASSAFLFAATSYTLLTQSIFPVITNILIMVEQVRLFMKLYSFVRESAPRVLQYKPSKDGKQEHNLHPTARQYVYYLFAPTMIYKDSYPRGKKISYRFIVKQILHCVACPLFCYIAWATLFVDNVVDAGTRPLSVKEATVALGKTMLVGALAMFLLFYYLLHSWMNLWAEILRFSDREFYQDWWNSTTFSEFYKKWNTIVYDWLYTYVYIDLIKMGFSRSLSQVLVFILSGAIHEYILALSFGFFYPLVEVIYLITGVSLMFLKRHRKGQFWNIIMWTLLFTEGGFLIFGYCLELFARANCKRMDNPIQDFFIPRTWSTSCHIITFS